MADAALAREASSGIVGAVNAARLTPIQDAEGRWPSRRDLGCFQP